MSEKSNRSAKNPLVPRILGTAVCFLLAACCWMLIMAITITLGTAATSPNNESVRSGQATATHCWSDGLLFMNLWEKCQLKVSWEDGTNTTTTSNLGDSTGEDIGRSAPVTLDEVTEGQGGYTDEIVSRDMERPWAWAGWLLSAPLFLLIGIFIITGIIFLKPPKTNKKKRRGKSGKSPAKQQQ